MQCIYAAITNSLNRTRRRAGSKRHKRSARRSQCAWEGLREGRDAGASKALATGAPRRGGRGHQKTNARIANTREASGLTSRCDAGESAAGSAWESAINPSTTQFRLLRRRVFFLIY